MSNKQVQCPNCKRSDVSVEEGIVSDLGNEHGSHYCFACNNWFTPPPDALRVITALKTARETTTFLYGQANRPEPNLVNRNFNPEFMRNESIAIRDAIRLLERLVQRTTSATGGN